MDISVDLHGCVDVYIYDKNGLIVDVDDSADQQYNHPFLLAM